ncbi:hypothetical protein [Nocardiopsis chromatogenes]|uniref:hypothetical protein n=1 Tax=Nocardiopsis chromatogenes TaxID=280239 RepID=UPI00034BA029|nr:hypothetical protein [Nocardiopsis chromatogenes]
MRFLYLLIPAVLLRLAMPFAGRHVPEPPPRPAPAASPPATAPPEGRRSGSVPPPVPDYIRFCEVAVRRRARWRLTYGPGSLVPYRAHHLVEGVSVAASEVHLLDVLLSQYEPPSRVRPYAPEGDAERATERRLLAEAAREVA